MKGTNLGEFEEVVLLSVAILREKAYGMAIKVEIRRRLGRNPSIGALHASFNRLEEKGFLESRESDVAPERGGRRRRYYKITRSGANALQKARSIRDDMWKSIGDLSFGFGK
ncbi:MAG: helix-turn-helix transcriptional regulator [Bacteroidota bacterium]